MLLMVTIGLVKFLHVTNGYNKFCKILKAFP